MMLRQDSENKRRVRRGPFRPVLPLKYMIVRTD